MANRARFWMENVGFSAVGHLLVFGLIVFLTGIVLSDTERVFAPDRIQITMIDLSQVRISGDETVLYNTNTPTKPESNEVAAQKTVPEPAPDVAPQEKIETPSIIDNVADKQNKESAKEKTPDNAPAPKKKTVVRVNRNVVALDRTLTVSVVDALRVAMTRCWTIDTKHPGVGGIRAVAHLTMRQNGTVSDVWFESAARADTDAAFAYVLDTIRNAINACQPLRMLPRGEYDKWKKIQLTFYPTTGAVM